MKVQDRLKELRESKGLSQEQLADILQVDRSTVTKWESGGSKPTRYIRRLADFYKVSTDYILCRELTPPPTKQDNILESLYADNDKIMDFVKQYGLVLLSQKPVVGTVIGEEEKIMFKHVILSSITKSKDFIKSHGIVSDSNKNDKVRKENTSKIS